MEFACAHRWVCLVVLGMIAAGVCGPAIGADTTSIPATMNNWVYQAAPGITMEYGNPQYLLLCSRSGFTNRSLMYFWLSPIPENAYIDNATLTLYCRNNTGSGLRWEVNMLTDFWNASTVTWNN